MDRGAVIARLDALCAAARARMPDRATSPDMAFAEIHWMTDAEVTEMHALKAHLPTAGQEAAAARQRIAERIKARKQNIMHITSEAPFFTVEQASRWLTCAQPVPLPLLQRLGKDCSMVCRIRGATFVDVPVQGKNWPTERGYPAAIIQEVFQANPDTRPFIPQPAAKVAA